jgi:hypothetical protein
MFVAWVLPFIIVVTITTAILVRMVWSSWDRVDRELVRAEPLVGPVRHDAMVVAATLEQAGFVPSPRGWLWVPGFDWRLLNLVRPDGTTAEIVSGARSPNFSLSTRLTDGRRLLTTPMAFLPVVPNVLRQTFPGADVSEVLHHHDVSLATLTRDESTVPCNPADVDHLIVTYEVEEVNYLRQRRLVNALAAVWRQLVKSPRDVGPVTSRTGSRR